MSVKSAHADDSEDPFLKAQDKMNQKMGELFNTVVNGGTITQQGASALQSQFLTGTQLEMIEASKQNMKTTLSQAGMTGDGEGSAQPSKVDVKKFAESVKEQRAIDERDSKAGMSVLSQEGKAPERPEVALDGGNIPKELSFSGPSKKKKPTKAELARAAAIAKLKANRKPAQSQVTADVLKTQIPSQ